MRSQEREPDLVRAGGSEIHRDIMSEEPFCVEIYRKKCTWTGHKGHFVWKFTGKMPHAPGPTWTYKGPFLLLP